MTVTETPRSDAVRVPAAPTPIAAAKAGYVAALMALLLIGIGALALRDAAVDAGWLRGEPLIPKGFDAIAEFGPQQWMVPAGIALAVLGIVLAVIALLPRRATAVGVDAATPVFVRHGDVARVATAAALEVPGVLDAKSTASSRKVTVRCRVTGDGNDFRALVTDAVTAALEPLHNTPRTAVRVRQEDRS